MKVTLVLFQYGKIMPLAAAYLASGLERAGLSFELNLIRIEDFNESGRSVDYLTAQLLNSSQIIAVGCYSDMLPSVLLALNDLKIKCPDKITVLGGIGPTIVAELILDSFNFIDYVIKYCGINALPQLVKSISNKDKEYLKISGLLYRRGSGLEQGNTILSSLSKSQFPSYHLINNIASFDVFPIRTSMGCPYKCTFCYGAAFLERRVDKRCLADVMEEIRLINELKGGGCVNFDIIDEAFIVDKKRVINFCDLLMKSGINTSWMCYGRVDCVNEDVLLRMQMAGCKELYFGVESGSNRLLKIIKKGFTREEASKAILLAQKVIPRVIASFIYRFPFETLSDFIDTYAFLHYLNSRGLETQLHALTPIRGTEIYMHYRNCLDFSVEEPSSYLGGAISLLPGRCVDFIKRYPQVFYDYGYYKSKDFTKISRFIREHDVHVC